MSAPAPGPRALERHPAERAPDLIEPLLGFRFWRVGRRGTLRCLASREAWAPGVNSATCWRRDHPAPARLCSCGFNALHELPAPQAAGGRRGVALGAIAAWGQVDLHRLGFRAERARLVALAFDGTAEPCGKGRLEQAAERYAVPLLPRLELAAAAEGAASPADPSLLPGRPRRTRHGLAA